MPLILILYYILFYFHSVIPDYFFIVKEYNFNSQFIQNKQIAALELYKKYGQDLLFLLFTANIWKYNNLTEKIIILFIVLHSSFPKVTKIDT